MSRYKSTIITYLLLYDIFRCKFSNKKFQLLPVEIYLSNNTDTIWGLFVELLRPHSHQKTESFLKPTLRKKSKRNLKIL